MSGAAGDEKEKKKGRKEEQEDGEEEYTVLKGEEEVEGKEGDGSPTPHEGSAEEQEQMSQDMAALGMKVEEIKASLVIRYERVSQSNPAILVSVASPLLLKEDGEAEPEADGEAVDDANAAAAVDVDAAADVPRRQFPGWSRVCQWVNDIPVMDRRMLHLFALLFAIFTSFLVANMLTGGEDTQAAEPGGDVYNAPQFDTEVTEQLQTANVALQADIANLQEINIDPIKISGSEGAKSRQLRETINNLITENEDIRLSVARLWLSEQETTVAQKTPFNEALSQNNKFRIEAQKLRHLGADLQDLGTSLGVLKEENLHLRADYADFKYQKVPLPKELDVVSREVEGLVKQVHDASRKRKPPQNLPNAKSYVSFMAQVLNAMSSLHEFGEANMFGKLDIATDVFTDIAPKPSSVPAAVSQKLKQGRAKFDELKKSLSSKWGQLKSLSEPDNIKAVGRDTLAKMNRVLVNVVSRLKDIGQTAILRRGKTPVDKVAASLADKLTVLDTHFDKTWEELENEVNMDAVDKELAIEMAEDEGDPEDDETLQEGEGDTETTDDKAAKQDESDTKPSASVGDAKRKGETSEKATKKKEKATDSKIAKTKPKQLSKKDGSDGDKKNKKQDGKEAAKEENLSSNKKYKTESNARSGGLVSKAKVEKKTDNKLQKSNEKTTGRDENNNSKDGKSSKSTSPDKQKDGSQERYFKGHYNKDKSGGDSMNSADAAVERRKHFRRQDSEDEDDNDDTPEDDGKKSRLMRHWEKPVKKNFFREAAESRRQFIRRKD